MCVYIFTFICHIYFQMVCQKLCQNGVSGRESFEESTLYDGTWTYFLTTNIRKHPGTQDIVILTGMFHGVFQGLHEIGYNYAGKSVCDYLGCYPPW